MSLILETMLLKMLHLFFFVYFFAFFDSFILRSSAELAHSEKWLCVERRPAFLKPFNTALIFFAQFLWIPKILKLIRYKKTLFLDTGVLSHRRFAWSVYECVSFTSERKWMPAFQSFFTNKKPTVSISRKDGNVGPLFYRRVYIVDSRSSWRLDLFSGLLPKLLIFGLLDGRNAWF